MTEYYNEIDPYAAQWLRNLILEGNLPRGDVDERSIADVRADDLRGYTQCHFFAGIGGWPYALRLAGWPDERPVWTGSCPCQPFSVAGQKKGEADARHLWPEFLSLISSYKPSVIFGEQVAKKAGRDWLSGVRCDLGVLGYEVGCADLCSSTVEIPQERERLFWVANAPGAATTGWSKAVRRVWGDEQMETHRKYADWRESCEVGVLDDGIPSRLAKAITRGFGNAIVPQVAQAFIEAFMEVRP